MKDLTSLIQQNLKKTKICYIIALIIFIIQFILAIILNVAKIIVYKIQINIVLISFFDFTGWMTFCWVISSFFIGIFVEKIFSFPNTFKYNKTDDFNFTITTNNYILIMTVVIISSSPILIALVSVLNKQYGTYGLSIIPVFIGRIFFIIAYFQTIKKFHSNNKEQKRQIVETNKANDLLGRTGKIFFIKYYNQLKKQNTIDIIDIIQENYSEQTKRNRIKSAKKIFLNHLQIETLNIILSNKDGVLNEELLKTVKELLEKEIIEQKEEKLTKKNVSETPKQKPPEIIPSCSICKYYIDDTTCEIWIKKPACACEEFKKNKNYLNFKI